MLRNFVDDIYCAEFGKISTVNIGKQQKKGDMSPRWRRHDMSPPLSATCRTVGSAYSMEQQQPAWGFLLVFFSRLNHRPKMHRF